MEIKAHIRNAIPSENTRLSSLLTTTELLDIYSIPVFNEVERREYFTLSDKETKVLNSFKAIDDAVHFAISLVFFKIKKTLVKFSYREITLERQHIMERYFPNRTFPKSLPSDYTKIARIENKILDLCDYQRFTGECAQTIKEELLSNVPKKIIYQHVAEKVLLPTAKLLIDGNFDTELLYWR